MDLTPEERQRIYEEEKARIEARAQIEKEQQATPTIPSGPIRDATFGEKSQLGCAFFSIFFTVAFVVGIFFWPLGLLLLVFAVVGGGVAAVKKSLIGPCPYCGTQINVDLNTLGQTCRGCKKRVMVKDRTFYRVSDLT